MPHIRLAPLLRECLTSQFIDLGFDVKELDALKHAIDQAGMPSRNPNEKMYL